MKNEIGIIIAVSGLAVDGDEAEEEWRNVGVSRKRHGHCLHAVKFS